MESILENYKLLMFSKGTGFAATGGNSKLVRLLAHSLILKKSDRLRDKLRSQELLEKIVKMNYKFPAFYNIAILHLLDLLLLELKITGNIQLITVIEEYLDIGYNYVELTNNETMRLEYIILGSRLKFIKLEFQGAIDGLEKGLQTALKNEMFNYVDIITDEINLLKLEYEKIRLLSVDNKDDLKEIADTTNLDNLIGKILNKRKIFDKKMLRNYITIAMESVNK